MYISSCQNFSAPSLLKILCTQFFFLLAVTQLTASLASFFFFLIHIICYCLVPVLYAHLLELSCNFVPYSCTPPFFIFYRPLGLSVRASESPLTLV